MAAIEDIRLHVTFFQSPKTRRLMQQLGPIAVVCLIRLWIWTAMNRQSGTLSGIAESEIEVISEWTGDNGAFVGALIEIGFLVRRKDVFRIKSWSKYQPWIVKAPQRSAKARRAANARHKPSRNGSSGSKEAMEIYLAYPLQRDRNKALAAIEEALEQPGVSAESLLAATKEYARAVSHWNRDAKKFIPSPAKWFSDARYTDDPKTWFSNAPNGKDPNDIDDDFLEGNDL